ncbi:hypothetical protein [Dipodfec virus UOA04_Rod_1017]|nr:hypothetical protein [Dipodfec virus UOA04_Rod_1017]
MTHESLLDLESRIPPYDPKVYSGRSYPYGIRLKFSADLGASFPYSRVYEVRFRKISTMVSHLNRRGLDGLLDATFITPSSDPLNPDGLVYTIIPTSLLAELIDPTLF